jgi:hypothetical protein
MVDRWCIEQGRGSRGYDDATNERMGISAAPIADPLIRQRGGLVRLSGFVSRSESAR